MTYFFDSYAIIELMEGNPAYKKFEDLRVITAVLNIGEVYAVLLRNHGKKEANEWFENFDLELLEILPENMVEATYFRYTNRKKDLSITDAVGYTLSIKHNLKFLTGDRQFENLPNVEFVK
ncbi:PIN domain-containing protein [Candidatus Woesearchaeota archaeon]|nr:PIN domain-containing protein [Candidatus Woesearchaeota archaeon]